MYFVKLLPLEDALVGFRDGGSELFLPIPTPILYFSMQPIPILQKIPIFTYTDTNLPSLVGLKLVQFFSFLQYFICWSNSVALVKTEDSNYSSERPNFISLHDLCVTVSQIFQMRLKPSFQSETGYVQSTAITHKFLD